ncbi:MAG: B12-binding domain-containing radical SAM protein [Desulfobacterales bacterium]|nr:B12-binding domain-containing radical SAM protein [Desulfobacterales bacterium]
MKHDAPHILLVNPWIHDFAAYDFWAKPLGLLSLAAILVQHEFNVSYMDCLDRFHPRACKADPYARNGRGPYIKTFLPKPKGLEDVPRNFSRYGIKPEWFKEDLHSISEPNLILVTSLMTYWYPGVQETITVLKEAFPNTPIVLGGIYASLCPDHAKVYSGADKVVTGSGESNILKLLEDYTGFAVHPKFDPDDFDTYPYPAFDLQRKFAYIPILTSRGCPFDCSYCASRFLNPKRMLRNPEAVVSEIIYWYKKYNIEEFAFYDDALLVNARQHVIPILEGIINTGLKLRLHTPNAVHVRRISKKIAHLMYRSGFKTIRLGLETTGFESRKDLDQKVTQDEFEQAVVFLKDAGFNKNMIGAYLLAGLPDQTLVSIEDSIKTVKQSGITPVLAYYTPIPQTALWKRAVACSRYDLESDPIFTNNAIWPCRTQSFSWKTITHLKNLAAFH